MSELLALNSNPSMCSVGDFPARTSVWPVKAPGLTVNGQDCGANLTDSLASYDRATSSWRTSQRSLFGGFSEYLETWPRAGSMRNGTVFLRQPLAPLTDATECGSWPTPTCSDVMGTTEFHQRKEAKPETNHAITLAQKVQWTERRQWPTPTVDDSNNVTRQSGEFQSLTRAVMFPTPCATDGDKGGRGEQRNSLPLNAVIGGALNPAWVEWLMGFPVGWTDCEVSAMP